MRLRRPAPPPRGRNGRRVRRQPVVRDHRGSRRASGSGADHRAEDRGLPRGARAVRVRRRPRCGARDRTDANRAAPRPRDSVSTVRTALALHWPALLVGAACVGLALSIWVAIPFVAALLLVVTACAGVLLTGGIGSSRRSWRRSGGPRTRMGLAPYGCPSRECARRRGGRDRRRGARHRRAGPIVSVVDARHRRHARRSGTRRCASASCSSCRSAARLRGEPSSRHPSGSPSRVPEEDGFDERAWLARQGIHVVLDASSWRQTGRRGGIAGFGDVLRERIERAVTRGAGGTRRGIVLGVVLGEDEGLSAEVRDDFRASGLYHLLAVSGQNVAFLAARDLRARLVAAAPAVGSGGLDPRHHRGLRPRGRVAAVRRASRSRRRARLARVARRQTGRPLALPRARSARAHGLDADIAPRARIPALVRGCRRDLRRGPARATASRRLRDSPCGCGCVLGRARVRCRHGADRAHPLR